ncbi:Protein of unknown function [Cotesia congregata]|uniref:Uncharacterized protein n=1 Tax=Cotesia congregata TaxID=51543 RepID=A0A8J2HMB5_COTCN|nr:Protein of unknown function [Cotesia congregata]
MVTNIDQDKFIYNFTDIALPEEVVKTLRLEPKFGLPLEKRTAVIPTIIKDI